MSAEALTPEAMEALKAKLLRCRDDEIFALENLIVIVDKRKRARFMRLWESQKLAIRHMGRINYEVKIRQEGRTTLHMGRALFRARFRRNFEALILAHEEDAAPVLFSRLKEMDKALPAPVQGEKKTDAAKVLRYKDNNSLLRIVTAGASEAVSAKKGRSATPDWVHVTEAAYIPYLDTLLQGLLGSLPPHGVLTMESTSNGPRGTFYAGCMKIKAQGKEIVPGQVWQLGDQVLKFTGLLHHEEYRADASAYEGPTDEEEVRLLSLGAVPETLMWRRQKLEELTNDPKRAKGLSPAKQFKREWPATLEDAFEESGSNFFAPAMVRLEKENARLRNEKEPPVVAGLKRQNGRAPEVVPATEYNKVTLWELPEEGWQHRYLVFADVGQGNASSDPDCVFVFDRLRRRVVAAAHGLYGSQRLAPLALVMAEYFGLADFGWDSTNVGNELRPLVLQSGYPLELVFHRRRDYRDPDKRENDDWRYDTSGFGLDWNQSNREVALSLLRAGVEGRQATILDEDFFDEAQQFGYNEHGKPEAAHGYHDDRVMTAAGVFYLDAILPPPVKVLPVKPFQDAHVLREKIQRGLQGRVRGVVYDGMEVG